MMRWLIGALYILLIAGSGTAAAQSAGAVFRDCPQCPEMVVIPAGSFFMGSPKDEPGYDPTEGPVHRVKIAQSFALGKYAVTFDEWDACVAGGGCNGFRPGDQGWGRGRRPVINVSWNDAQAYVQWLSKKSGKSYRLPSEAEWEYAARAGTNTPFYTGQTITTDQANFASDYNGDKKEFRGMTLPVGSFPPNPFGLYDMAGNVSQWVEDRWHGDYQGAPGDGSGWTTGDGNSARVRRGGSWNFVSNSLRSAERDKDSPDCRDDIFTFRVARILNP